MSWDGHEDFEIEVDGEDDVISLKCKVCSVNINEVRKEAKARNIRGNVLNGLLNLVDGVNGAHKGNIMRHVKADGLHDWAGKKFSTKGTDYVECRVTDEPSTSNRGREKQQLGIERSTIENPVVKENYRKLFVTALFIAPKEKPLSDFSELVDLQKKNGIRFFEGKYHEKACGEFIDYLANTLRADIKNILGGVPFFSITMDGSQTRKTGFEKELVYTNVVRGKAVELLLKCVHMNFFLFLYAFLSRDDNNPRRVN